MAASEFSASDVVVYGVGPVTASVCYPTAMPIDEVTAAVNFRLGPTGLAWGWSPGDDPTFASGQTNPCPCNDHPAEREHRLYHC